MNEISQYELSAGVIESGDADLGRVDPLSELILSAEDARQQAKLILIPSESACPPVVRRVLGSVFTDLYAEGLPEPRATSAEAETSLELECQLAYYRRYADKRYYQGCDYANLTERLARRRAAELFATDVVPAGRIYVNVQPLSGAAANNAVYEACLEPGDAIMGMDLTHGGHLTHGSPYNRSGKYYRVTSYGVDGQTGRIDYDAIAALAEQAQPRLIVAGASAYPWDIDWRRLREIADALPQPALLMADIAHPAGLVVAGLFPNPIGYADFVTFTTHKTLIGPRGAAVLTTDADLADRVNRAVFPGEQGGPHMNNIAAMSVAFKLAATPEFKAIQERTVSSARALAAALQTRGLTLAYGGTNTHLLLLDLKSIKPAGPAASAWYSYPLKGDIAARVLDLCNVVCNKNTIPGDTNAGDSSAIRLGLTWAVQRGLGPEHMDELADIIHGVVTRIDPFRYAGPAGDLPRGKTELAVIEEARERVHTLLQKTINPPPLTKALAPVSLDGPERELTSIAAAEQESAAQLALTDNGILRISGERARAFLQEVLTASIMQLKPGQACRSLLLDRDGKTMATPLVMCLEPERDGQSRYLLNTDAPDRVRSWLSALSDGLVRFDDDLLAKIDGPVMIDTLGDMVTLALRGPQASIALARLAPGISGMRSGTFEEGEVAGGWLLVARADEEDGTPSYALVVSRIEAKTLWEAASSEVESIGGAVARAASLDGLASANAVVLSKPYFVGQSRLLAHAAPPTTPKEVFHFEPAAGEPRRSALYEEHLKLTPRRNMVDFAGWLMPVRYTTTSEEYAAVRERAAIFDLSHMGVLEFGGDGATRFLDMACTNYVPWLKVGQSHYSFALDSDGQPMDDIFVYRLALDRYMVVVNAANSEKMNAWFRAVNEHLVLIDRQRPACEVDATCTIRDLKEPSSGADQRVDVAIQGPCSLAILQRSVDDPKDAEALCRLRKFGIMEAALGGIPAIITRTGYTGEPLGYELYVHPEAAPTLWNLLLDNGKDFGLLPAGLGARDAARTEAGLPLYGHELAGPYNVSPAGAGYGSFVKLHKPFFIGRDAYIAAENVRQSQIVRFRVNSTGVRMARQGDPVVNSRGVYIGAVTSSVAVGGIQVGMAYVDRRYVEPGTRIAIFTVSGQGAEQEAKHPAALSPGERIMLPLDATIIERFMTSRAT